MNAIPENSPVAKVNEERTSSVIALCLGYGLPALVIVLGLFVDIWGRCLVGLHGTLLSLPFVLGAVWLALSAVSRIQLLAVYRNERRACDYLILVIALLPFLILGFAFAIYQYKPQPEWRKHEIASSQAYSDGDLLEWERQELLALAKWPGDGDDGQRICYHLASDFERQGRHSEAELYFKKSIEVALSSGSKDIVDAHLALGRFYDNREKYDLAEKSYVQALTEARMRADSNHDSDVRNALAHASNLYIKHKDYDRAVDAYRQIFDMLESECAEMEQNASSVWAAKRRNSKRSLRRIRELTGDEGEGLVELLKEAGRSSEAEQLSKHVTSTYPQSEKSPTKNTAEQPAGDSRDDC